MMKYRFARIFATAMVLALAACGARTPRPQENQDVLTREQMEAADVSNLYDAVSRLRPRWLNIRSARSMGLPTEILVYQGQTRLGGPDVLKQMSPEMVLRLRYLDSATASASLPGIGSRHVAGAIVIETARQDP